MSLQFLSYHCVVPGGHLTGLQLIRLKSSPLGCRKARRLYINKVKSCLRAFDSGWGRVMPYPVPYAFRPQPLAAFTIGVGLCVGILASQLPRGFLFWLQRDKLLPHDLRQLITKDSHCFDF